MTHHLRKLSDGDYTARWCASCDRHFRACRCETPDFRARRNGQLSPLPEPYVATDPDPYRGGGSVEVPRTISAGDPIPEAW